MSPKDSFLGEESTQLLLARTTSKATPPKDRYLGEESTQLLLARKTNKAMSPKDSCLGEESTQLLLARTTSKGTPPKVRFLGEVFFRTKHFAVLRYCTYILLETAGKEKSRAFLLFLKQ
jgi:hypothetical protein